MRILLAPEKRSFSKPDFEQLRQHYQEQVMQIHIMDEYAKLGLERIRDALQLTADYFALKQDRFLGKWLSHKEKELEKQTTVSSWKAIVEVLSPAQKQIVVDDREKSNVLVLAGPGSGKTRVLVHRIAYLIRVRREDPRGIIALAYNRHAAVEIRKRLDELIGDDSRKVMVMTCHALAMRLTGTSYSHQRHEVGDDDFKQVLKEATALLKGEGLQVEQADEQRDRLLAGFRWILVDEYQDVGAEQYELIAALAGRTLDDDERKLSLFVVGDDDQNIYDFAGASVEYIRRFERDYQARPVYLTENYRSTRNIVEAANTIVAAASQRMKVEHPITVNRARAKEDAGGAWQKLDTVARGRVQILPVGPTYLTQAMAVMMELQRLAGLNSDWRWDRVAVIARQWKLLHPVRAWCEANGVPVQMADEDCGYFWRLRETQSLVALLRQNKLFDVASVKAWIASQKPNCWWSMLQDAMDNYANETGENSMPVDHGIEWLAEWGREQRRSQRGLLLLTAHSAKGLEFDHVVVLDGLWQQNKKEDIDSQHRLYYVAMTRAKQQLILCAIDQEKSFVRQPEKNPAFLRRDVPVLPTPPSYLERDYKQLALSDVDLGYAGRLTASHKVHRHLAALHTGDKLVLNQNGDKWELLDDKGVVVGRLAKAWWPPTRKRCLSATVQAIIVRRQEDSTDDYRSMLRCESWELLVPELVFE